MLNLEFHLDSLIEFLVAVTLLGSGSCRDHKDPERSEVISLKTNSKQQPDPKLAVGAWL